MVELINLDPAVLDALVTCDESCIYCYDLETKRPNSKWKHAGSPSHKKARQSKSTQKILIISFFFLTALAWSTWLGSHCTESQQGILCWGFKGVQEEIPSEEASTVQIASGIFTRTMHQSITPSLSQTIWPRWASRQLLSLPIVQTLLPVTFGYSLSLLDNWGDESGCDNGQWHTHTRGLPWGLPEVVGTVQQVHCSRRRLLWRGLDFHVCTIKKSAHTKKVWKLI